MNGNQSGSPSMAGLPFLTDTPGIGGLLKSSPEDFVVDEIPLYEPCGEGEFLYLRVRKRDVSATELTAHLAQILGTSANEIGMAGRKDRCAVTTQWVSVPAASLDDPARINTDRIHVLESHRHRHKLRTGHLAGNRFEIVLREPHPTAPSELRQRVDSIAEDIQRLGFLNYYGEQRFGRANDTDETGFQLLRGGNVRRLKKSAFRFALSAAQSRLFNDWAAVRARDGLTHCVLHGDVMQVVASGGCFVCTDVQAEKQRFETGETVLTGPVFGPKMRMPDGVPAEREAEVLRRFDLTLEAFSRFRKLTRGTRRALLVRPDGFSAAVTDNTVRLRFSLPSGAYATSLLREFIKSA